MALQVWKLVSRLSLNSSMPVSFCPHLKLHSNMCRLSTSSRIFAEISTVESDEERASELLNALKSKGVSLYSEERFCKLYHYLLGLGIKHTTLEAQFLETPDLLRHPTSSWKSVCTILTEIGVPSDVAFKNIAVCPALLKCNQQILHDNMAKLSDIYIGNFQCLQVFQRNPELYMLPVKAIRKRVDALDGIFPPQSLKTLLKNNSNILTDPWNTVIDKIMYIHEEMGLEQPHIAESEALQKSLLHIKMRHQFLFRAGLYIKPNLLRDQKSDKKNPDLSFITDTSNKFFANKVARLTDYEYDVFCSMIIEEEESRTDEDDDSDYD